MVQVNVGGNIDITVDNKLSFEPHLNKICKKVSQKLYALARISTHISLKKLGMIMREFIISRYSYCPLVRYAIAGLLNNKTINVMNGLKDMSIMIVSQHLKNYLIKIIFLVSIIEICKYLLQKCLNVLMLSQTLWMIYLKKNEISCNLRNNCHFISRNIKSVYHWSETISCSEPKI